MYQLKIKTRAQKDVKKLTPSHRTRLAELIRSLAQGPRPVNSKKLTNREEWRLCYGNYRILYTIDDENKTITIVRVKHRREAYRLGR